MNLALGKNNFKKEYNLIIWNSLSAYKFLPVLILNVLELRDVIKRKIREFLYNQLEDERCLTAVLIIHTCNSPRDRVELCVETLSKYIDNIVNNPAEIKYRKIRKNNKAFNERVASLEGTAEFLEGCGFRVLL